MPAPNWRDEYLVNLQEAERANPVNKELVSACACLPPPPSPHSLPFRAQDSSIPAYPRPYLTRGRDGPPRPPGSQLADRIAALEAEKAALLVQQQLKARAATKPPAASSSPSDAHATTTTTPPNADGEAAVTAQLRLDLAEALRARGQAEARLRASETELRDLRARTKTDARKLYELTAERNALAAKLKDRNEELVGKNKLLKVRRIIPWPAMHTRSGGGRHPAAAVGGLG